MALEVFMFPCLSDNYGFLIHDPTRGVTGCIDTPDVAAIENALAEKEWTLTHIFNTHHHHDHAGGNLALKQKTGCQIIGYAGDAKRIPGIDIKLNDGDEYAFGQHRAKILFTPGHTLGHIVYYFAQDKIAFVGDTLFALGCGRLFEGSAEQMWNSLQKLMQWPDETKIYCAHEYTQANARFALSMEPNNQALQARSIEINQLLTNNIPTIPTTIGLEKKTNPFLRPHSEDLKNTLNMTGENSLVNVFTETRRRKDRF